MRRTKVIVVAIAIIVAVYIFAAPYITVYRMKNSADNHDGEALSEHVDFPALRQSLKDQMNAMFAKEMAKEAEDNPYSALGAVFGGVMVEKMVDAYVTPAAITEFMKGKPDPNQADDSSSSNPSSDPFANASMSYESFSKFSITIIDEESSKEVKFILRRKGIGWKLTEIMLPL